MILQRAGDDFGCRSRAAIDQHNERLVFCQVAGACIETLSVFGIAATGGYDLALLQESIRHRDRLIEQAARIVAQVENITLELVVGDLRADIGDRLLQPFGGLLIKLVSRI